MNTTSLLLQRIAFEMSTYRRRMKISWIYATEHRANQSCLDELAQIRRFLPDIRRHRLKYFGHIVRGENLSTAIVYSTWSHHH